MVKTDQYNPEEALAFLKRRDVNFGALMLAVHEAVVYLLEDKVKTDKHMQRIWDSDANAMEDMAKQAKEIADKEKEMQAK